MDSTSTTWQGLHDAEKNLDVVACVEPSCQSTMRLCTWISGRSAPHLTRGLPVPQDTDPSLEATMLIVLVLILSFGPPVRVRTSSGRVQGQSVVLQLLNELQSPDVLQRERAFNELLRTPGALADPPVSGAILDLLERETRLIEATLRESKGEVGVGERFGEYYSAVADTVDRTGDKKNKRVLEALAKSAYNADSPFAIRLAKEYGTSIVSPVLETTRSDVPTRRADAIWMLDSILLNNEKLSRATIAQIQRAVTDAVADKDVRVRQLAVRALGDVGSTTNVALLTRVAQTDEGSFTTNNGKLQRYPVREEAEKAIAKIIRRSGSR